MSIITTVCLISTILTSLSIHSSVRASHLDRIGLDTSSYLLSMADKISPTEDLPDGKEKVCLTKECRKIGKLYDMAMDKTVHPCDNFYQYSCGNWEGSSQDLGYEGTVRQLDILSEITEDRRQAMLWHPPYDTDIQPVQQAKIFFQSCMDYTAREVRGIRTIAAVIGSAGGWPMAMTTEYWSNTSRTWQAVDESHVRLGMNNAFFSINPGIDQGKDGKPVIVVNAPDPGDLPVIRNNYDDYREFVQDVLEEFIRYDKATISPEQLEKDIYDLYIFEHKLNKIREISGVNIISFNPQRKYSEQEIYWQKIIRHHFALNILEINETYQASLVDPYYNLLPKLLDSTETRTIVNYIHWKFVSRTMRYTNTKMRNIYYRFKRSPDRLQECLKDTKLIYAEVNWFLQNYFSDDYQKAVEIIAENVRNELNYQIDNSNWLQDSTKAALLDQISNITLFIGGPKWCTNQTAIEYHYETFITSPDYVSNMLSFWNYQNKYRFNLFSGSEKPPSWDTFPLTVSAHYRLASNVITITAGQLQTPFFGSTLPDYLNYGAIGSIIGHEFAHAADAASRFDQIDMNESNSYFSRIATNVSISGTQRYGSVY
ncbi:neprilysin-1-like isoform X2 [Diachasmimorpha longicaudata]|uniref:neprilysin-1-like isoform X2 n=1 Tax=Diachasmimorpha longicaudata TaxID=58733 RepID=UPI0030B8C78A